MQLGECCHPFAGMILRKRRIFITDSDYLDDRMIHIPTKIKIKKHTTHRSIYSKMPAPFSGLQNRGSGIPLTVRNTLTQNNLVWGGSKIITTFMLLPEFFLRFACTLVVRQAQMNPTQVLCYRYFVYVIPSTPLPRVGYAIQQSAPSWCDVEISIV